MNFSGKYGSRPSTSALSAPPRPASPQPNANVKANTCGTLMPSPLAARGSSTAARSRLPQRGEQAADHDDHQPVAAYADAEQVDLALQHGRQIDEDPLRAHDVVDG